MNWGLEGSTCTGGTHTSGVREHLHAAAEHGLEHGVLPREGAQRGVVQRAAHVQLHILAVRGQGLQSVRGGARLRTRGLRGLQAFGRGRRWARGLGRHASERRRWQSKALSAPRAGSRRPRDSSAGARPLGAHAHSPPLLRDVHPPPHCALSLPGSRLRQLRRRDEAGAGSWRRGAGARAGACAVGAAVAVWRAGGGRGFWWSLEPGRRKRPVSLCPLSVWTEKTAALDGLSSRGSSLA